MTDRAPAPATYWEARAARFAASGRGLGAVCSYGMPRFYNQSIDACQRLALRKHVRATAERAVLDVGCGVGRWSVAMAARGARVTGVDLSRTMLQEATRRAAAAGVSDRCRFLLQNVAELETGCTYDLILMVTVLQHVLDTARLEAAVARLAAHLRPTGRLVMLEAAPRHTTSRCDSDVFTARTEGAYADLFERHGLRVRSVSGVDPMPLRMLLLPHYRHLPKPVALAGLAAATLMSFPIDAVVGRRWVAPSWHKVFVMARTEATGHA